MKSTLSNRQTQVAALLLAGKTRPQIGQELGIRTNTVRMYAREVYARLGVRGRTELLRCAIVRGWVPRVDRGLTWTRREQQVLNGLLRGERQAQVAESVGIGLSTLDLVLHGMRRYAGVSTTSELLRVAVEQQVAA